MKIIDLLNKIANGEEPKIKYKNFILKYNKNEKRFIDKDRLNSLYEIDFSKLNDEIEIIGEKKLPEKCRHAVFTYSSLKDINYLEVYVNDLTDTVNELLDYLESKEKGE